MSGYEPMRSFRSSLRLSRGSRVIEHGMSIAQPLMNDETEELRNK